LKQQREQIQVVHTDAQCTYQPVSKISDRCS